MTRLATVAMLGTLALAPSVQATPARPARCQEAFVGARQQCLRRGQKCEARLRADYELAGFECRRRKLVPAGAALRRHGEFVELRPNGLPTLSTALQAFDKVVARLPGVHRERGAVGDTTSGTEAVKWLELYRSRLTSGQKRVLDRALAPKGNPVRAADAAQLQALIPETLQVLKGHGLVFNHPIDLVSEPKGEPGDYAFTDPQFLDKPGGSCVIHVTPLGAATADTESRALVAHELTHCAEAELVSTRKQYASVPPWVDEGFGSWAAATVVTDAGGALPPSYQKLWAAWIGRSEADLFTRAYTAIGFWALLRHEGQDPWRLYAPAVQAGAPIAAYGLVTSGAPNVLPDWGPSLALRPDAGTLWDVAGPGEPVGGNPNEATIGTGAGYGPAVQSRGGHAAALDLQADIIDVTPNGSVSGSLRTSDGSEQPLPGAAPSYCTRPGGCVCRDGTDLKLPPIPRGRALLGYASGLGGGSVQVSGHSLDERCGKPPVPPNHACQLLDRAGVEGVVGSPGDFQFISTQRRTGLVQTMCAWITQPDPDVEGSEPMTAFLTVNTATRASPAFVRRQVAELVRRAGGWHRISLGDIGWEKGGSVMFVVGRSWATFAADTDAHTLALAHRIAAEMR